MSLRLLRASPLLRHFPLWLFSLWVFPFWPAFAEDLSDDATIDLKPHYAPISAVELFTTANCRPCLKLQQQLNALEASAGNRRGRVIFLTYGISRLETSQRNLGQARSLQRERIQKRWNDYAQLTKSRRAPLPQLMINGRKYLSASPVDVLERAISRALLVPTKVALSLQLESTTRETAVVSYSVVGLPKSRSNDLYLLTVLGVKPHTPVPIFSTEGVDNDTIWANEVEASETVRVEEDDTGSVELQIAEAERLKVKEVVALLQDARTGQLISGETIHVKLPGRPDTQLPEP